MDGNFGLIRCNFHCIKKTLDSNKQVTPVSLVERVVSIKDGTKHIKCTIDNNIATITEDGYVEGSSVDIWLYCIRGSEGGSICSQKIVQADEDTYQAWLDSL